jgi:hypothetical protein
MTGGADGRNLSETGDAEAKMASKGWESKCVLFRNVSRIDVSF